MVFRVDEEDDARNFREVVLPETSSYQCVRYGTRAKVGG